MNDNLKNQLLAFVLFHIKKKVVDDKRLYIDDESLTDSDGFDYESTVNSTIGDSDNINFIKLNDLNNNYKTSKKTSSSENAYLKIDNQEYNSIGLQIDSIDMNNESNIRFDKMINKNKIEKIIDEYTETRENTENLNSEYIDIIDSNRLWDMIEKNNKMIYTDNYDELSLESESLNNIVRNSAVSKSVFLHTDTDNYKSNNIMNEIMNSSSSSSCVDKSSSSSSSEYDMVESYNFNNTKRKKDNTYSKKRYDNTYSNQSSDDLIDSYNVFHIKKNNKNIKKKEITTSNSDNISVIDTYCMSNVNKKTTSTLEECRKSYSQDNLNKNIDESNNFSNIFERYMFKSANFKNKSISNGKKEKFIIKKKESKLKRNYNQESEYNSNQYYKEKESEHNFNEESYSKDNTNDNYTGTNSRFGNSKLLLFRRRR